MLIRESSILLLAAALVSVPLTVAAQGKAPTDTAAKGGVVSVDTLVSRYSPLAGPWSLSSNPSSNATSLVNGVRNGGTVSLYGPMLEVKVENPPPTTKPRPCIPTPLKPCPPTTQSTSTGTPKIVIVMNTITFNSPLPGQGYGNIDVALALAEADATKNHHLTLPLTPEQLKAALLGGTVKTAPGATSTVTFQGVLALRAKGGWGEVAKTLNLELVDKN